MQVTGVADGDAAMTAFVEDQPDVVVADVNMPGISGVQICQMIKQDETTRHIPVILLTGSYEPFEPEQAAKACADFVFTKPFDSINELVDKVNELLAGESSSQGSRPETDDIEGLYRQSFEPEPVDEVEPSVAELTYAGMDEQAVIAVPPERVEEHVGALVSEPSPTENEGAQFSADEIISDDETITVTRLDPEESSVSPSGYATIDPFAAPVSITPPPPPVIGSDISSLRIEDVSQELIDEIVRQVVERMSDKVIRDVAEDTVPRITKKLLREALAKDLLDIK